MVGQIGDMVNTNGVVVGQACGYYALPNSLPAPDWASLFDPAPWCGTLVTLTAVGTLVIGSDTPIAVTATNTAAGLKALIEASASVGLGNGRVTAVKGSTTAFYIYVVKQAVGFGLPITVTGAGNTAVAQGWSPFGGTEQGWQVNYNPTAQTISIEEQQTPVAETIASAVYQFVANLSEDTVGNLAVAYNGTLAKTVVGATQPAKTRLTLGTVPIQMACVLETNAQANTALPRRYYVPQMVALANVGTTFRRAAAQRLIPVTLGSICPIGSIYVDEITAPSST